MLALPLVALSIVLGGSAVQAKTKSETAKACMEAVEAGNTELAQHLAAEIMEWRNVFATKAISDAEACLQSATGEFWKYFTTKGRFLSEDEARAEQAFIDGADERIASRDENRQRAACEVTMAQYRISRLEAEYEIIQQARAAETLKATIDTCTQLYDADRSAALRNVVCNDVFMQVGMPDTKHSFDFNALVEARMNLAVSALNLQRTSRGNDRQTGADNPDVAWCENFLAK